MPGGHVMTDQSKAKMREDGHRPTHPGLAVVYDVLNELCEAELPEVLDEKVRGALDIMAGWCSKPVGLPHLIQAAQRVVEAQDHESMEAILRIGDGAVNRRATQYAVQVLKAALAGQPPPPAPRVRSPRG